MRDSVPLPSSSNASAPVTAEGKASQAGSVQGNNGYTREAIVRDNINGLHDDRYEPNQRLQEAKLTAVYGISRGPVRDALYALSAIRIVDLTPQCGAQFAARFDDPVDKSSQPKVPAGVGYAVPRSSASSMSCTFFAA